jgi:tetratricopeptide (TPR) repeat protein
LSLLSQVLLLDKKEAESEKALLTAASINPELPSIYRNQARLLLKQSKPAEALEKAQSGYERSFDDLESLLVLAACLGSNQRDQEALLLIEKILKVRPNYAEAFANRAIIRLRAKDIFGSIKDAEMTVSIKPHLAQIWGLLGSLRYQIKNLSGAIEALNKAHENEPNNVGYMIDLGELLSQENKAGEAIAILENATELAPGNDNAWINLGVAFQQNKKNENAKTAYEKALAINPNSAEVSSNLGAIAKDSGDLNSALQYFEKALEIKPDYAEAHSNMGVTLQELGRLEEAGVSYQNAISLEPDYALAYYNYGVALEYLNRLDDVLENYDRAIVLKSDYTDAIFNKSLLKLRTGFYIEGWRLYERRWEKEPRITINKSYQKSLWLGDESIINKTLLIYPEQGLGDYIQFIRYADLVEQLGAKVILEVPSELMTLCSTLKGQRILIENGKPLPYFDYRCPVMSLPLALKTTVETIPAQIPYLYVGEERKKRWNRKLGNKISTRIGLVWADSNSLRKDKRSLFLNQLTRVLELPFEFHSIQKEVREIDIKSLIDFPRIHQHQDDLLDFSDPAALIDAMDLVISVDTAVAHLSGAMGKKTFLLLPYLADHRWMLDRTDSPWYPAVTLFRQPAMDDWDSVITEIRLLLSD